MPRRSTKSLTERYVASLKPPVSGILAISDSDPRLGGFQVRVFAATPRHPNGVKSFTLVSRLDGKQRRWTLGRHPAMKLTDARKKAYEFLDEIEAGRDPAKSLGPVDAATIKDTRTTFGDLVDYYVRREIPKLKRGKEVESTINTHLLPIWRDRPIEELRRRDALQLLDGLLDEDRRSAAYRTYEVIKRLGNYAIERDELESSPFAALKPPIKKVPRQVHLNDDQIRKLWPAFETMGYPFGVVLKMLLLTGLRLREVADAKWSEIDLDKGEFRIEHQRTKMGRPQLVPLSTTAREIVAGLQKFEGPFVFTTSSGARSVSGFSTAKARADALSGVAAWRIHDLRRTVRTGLAALGINDTIAERVLGHAPAKLVQTYNVHQYREEKADALELWSRHIMETIKPPPENVIKLRAAEK